MLPAIGNHTPPCLMDWVGPSGSQDNRVFRQKLSQGRRTLDQWARMKRWFQEWPKSWYQKLPDLVLVPALVIVEKGLSCMKWNELYIKHRSTLGLNKPYWQPFLLSLHPPTPPGLTTEEHFSLFAKIVTTSLASRYSGISSISQTMGAVDSHLHRWREGQEPGSTPRGAPLWTCQGPRLQIPGLASHGSEWTWRFYLHWSLRWGPLHPAQSIRMAEVHLLVPEMQCDLLPPHRSRDSKSTLKTSTLGCLLLSSCDWVGGKGEDSWKIKGLKLSTHSNGLRAICWWRGSCSAGLRVPGKLGPSSFTQGRNSLNVRSQRQQHRPGDCPNYSDWLLWDPCYQGLANVDLLLKEGSQTWRPSCLVTS